MCKMSAGPENQSVKKKKVFKTLKYCVNPRKLEKSLKRVRLEVKFLKTWN